MNINDILELMALCAVLFVPVGYALRKHGTRLRTLFRRHIERKRFIESNGSLSRTNGQRSRTDHG
ncbi:cellulose biosynthesis protein BcsF [Acetobacter peroxydans]|jgi:cellulose biosynthesis operon protein BcsF/YhjT|uniref:cellulose biosynthesis protein BcsF n=2 Tax=Acetobacter peroxydans TaxID=104098 RepID=UPI0038D06AB3